MISPLSLLAWMYIFIEPLYVLYLSKTSSFALNLMALLQNVVRLSAASSPPPGFSGLSRLGGPWGVVKGAKRVKGVRGRKGGVGDE